MLSFCFNEEGDIRFLDFVFLGGLFECWRLFGDLVCVNFFFFFFSHFYLVLR